MLLILLLLLLLPFQLGLASELVNPAIIDVVLAMQSARLANAFVVDKFPVVVVRLYFVGVIETLDERLNVYVALCVYCPIAVVDETEGRSTTASSIGGGNGRKEARY
ncbi:hypothetical protein BC939DRAFT_480366 [Gamsiella multidivaricata]|uniref:uncharacterized protein n=1 Tax=Gamsiella multidivaricata TaxID=101098 RepID=UPI00221F9226|nr:uncharacterized protein BC939DRAFT_480366 [Gamsiella multidivaricata]KAI7818479.1 hypothetical protein BC939DRAFT_480366 [Gamsiella multidivaricata]